jgi:DNA-binding transcriptional ArsR family regulator
MTAMAMKQAGLKPATKIVLYWLADHHNETTGACFPSIGRLAQLSELSRRAVHGHLEELERLGLIEVEPRHRDNGSTSSHGYVLRLSRQPVQNLHGGGAKFAPDPVQDLPSLNLGINNIGIEHGVAQDASIDGFETFWDQYPHRGGAKKGKDVARKAWARAITKAKIDQIHNGVMRYATDQTVVRGYAKDPATWLNQRGWEDDVEPSIPAPAAGGRRSATVDAFADLAKRLRS